MAQVMPKDGAHRVPKKGGTGEKGVPSQCLCGARALCGTKVGFGAP